MIFLGHLASLLLLFLCLLRPTWNCGDWWYFSSIFLVFYKFRYFSSIFLVCFLIFFHIFQYPKLLFFLSPSISLPLSLHHHHHPCLVFLQVDESIINAIYQLYLWNPHMGIQGINKCCFPLCWNKLFTVEIDNFFSQRSIDLSWNKLQKYWKKKYNLAALIDVLLAQLKTY